MATRGYLGGLAQATADAALVLDASGKEIIFIETVGVGQAEVEIAKLASCTLVVLMPGMGDDIQSLKAGLMEIGDIFVVNKTDREDAPRFEQQLLSILQIVPDRNGWKPPVVKTVAIEDKGVDDLVEEIARFRENSEGSQDQPARQLVYWKGWLLRLLQTRLTDRIIGERLSESEFEKLAVQVASRKMDPYAAVDQILAGAGLDARRS
jgi:LAO/AO transport system kinase